MPGKWYSVVMLCNEFAVGRTTGTRACQWRAQNTRVKSTRIEDYKKASVDRLQSMEYGDRLWSGPRSETVAATIGIMANAVTIALGKLLKVLRGRKEM